MAILGSALLALVAASTGTRTYRTDVKPILDAHCVECHHAGGRSPDFSTFPFATPTGAEQTVVVERMLVLTTGTATEAAKMPPGARAKLTTNELVILQDWLDEGLRP